MTDNNSGQKEEGMEHKPDFEAFYRFFLKGHDGLHDPWEKELARKIFDTHILPLQSEVKRLKELNAGILSNLKTADKCGGEVMSQLKELESEVKIKEARIRELEEERDTEIQVAESWMKLYKELEAEKDSFAIGFIVWKKDNGWTMTWLTEEQEKELLEEYKKTTLK